MKIIKVLNILWLILLYSNNYCPGQGIPKTFDELWQIAVLQNPEIINAELRVQRSARLKSTSWEPGMTNLEYSRGQINTIERDNYFYFEQELGSPFTISANRKFYDSEMNYFLLEKGRHLREVRRELRKEYYGWLFEEERRKILEESIKLYEKAEDFAAMQFESGESNLLSKALIQSQLQELFTRKNQVEMNKRNHENMLQSILNEKQNLVPADSIFSKLVIILPSNKQEIIDSIPEVRNRLGAVNVATSYLKVTRSHISPNLKAGYFNQEIDLVPGFQGWHVGLSFPILFHPQKARVQAASIDLTIAENEYQYQKMKSERAYEVLMNQHDQLTENLLYFEKNRLENARLIKENAGLLYGTGEIGYLEFVNSLSTAIMIEEEYWTLVSDYNRVVIDLYYYLNY